MKDFNRFLQKIKDIIFIDGIYKTSNGAFSLIKNISTKSWTLHIGHSSCIKLSNEQFEDFYNKWSQFHCDVEAVVVKEPTPRKAVVNITDIVETSEAKESKPKRKYKRKPKDSE